MKNLTRCFGRAEEDPPRFACGKRLKSKRIKETGNRMKRMKGVLTIVLCAALFCGCGKNAKETVTNRKIPVEDVSEFYYTRENINFNASYQRYRFFKEDGSCMFFHETREKPGAYGPTTEKDVTNSGTFELTAEEWNVFLAFLKDGRVSARKDPAESGGSGPWTFLYWKNDKGKDRVFEFPTYDASVRFEEYCRSLAQEARQPSDRDGVREENREENMKDIKILGVSYSPGYGDMLGGYHESALRKDASGSWTYVCSDREAHDRPTVVTTYAVSDEAVARFEEFLLTKNVLSLENRPKSDLFATDYSPWSWSVAYETSSFGKTKREYCSFDEYKRYSGQDYELLKELEERFTALRAERIAQTAEED